MTSGDAEGVRSLRLPISGDVVQWLPDGRWRMVSRDQFESEQSRDPRLAVVWNSPADLPAAVFRDVQRAGVDGSPGWHRSWGALSDEAVEARYADGCDAVVIVAGPLWVVESLDSVGTVDVAMGAPFAAAVARRLVAERMFDPGPEPTGSGERRGAWWGSLSQISPAQPTRESRSDQAGGVERGDLDPRVRQGIAYVVWNDNSHQRRTGRRIAEPDYYSCSLQPFGGQRLPVEDGPEVPTLDEALAWARARTTTILVRPQWDPGHYYTATDRQPSEWKRQR